MYELGIVRRNIESGDADVVAGERGLDTYGKRDPLARTGLRCPD